MKLRFPRSDLLPELFASPYICGIGGIGMSGVALLLLDLGTKVAGSDLRRSELTQMLEVRGASIGLVPSPERVREASVLIAPAGFPDSHPEIAAARAGRIPILNRTKAIAEICASCGIETTLCFGTTARGKLARFARFISGAGWCSGAACAGLPHAQMGQSMFLDLDEREFFADPAVWDAFPGADVVISDWRADAFQYYAQGCTAESFLAKAMLRPSKGNTVYPVNATDRSARFRCVSNGHDRDYLFEITDGHIKSPSVPLSSAIPLFGTHADMGAFAAATVYFSQKGLPVPSEDIACIGWFNPIGHGHFHEIRMHPVNIAIALRSLRQKAGGMPVRAAIKPFSSTLRAYPGKVWCEVFKHADRLLILTPPYEGCSDEDCSAFCSSLQRTGTNVQCATTAEAREIAADQPFWLWIGAPDVLPDT